MTRFSGIITGNLKGFASKPGPVSGRKRSKDERSRRKSVLSGLGVPSRMKAARDDDKALVDPTPLDVLEDEA